MNKAREEWARCLRPSRLPSSLPWVKDLGWGLSSPQLHKGNPTEASPASGMPTPFRQGVPRQSKQSQLYDCALAGLGENKDPFLCFPKSMAAAKGSVYTIFLVKNLFLFSLRCSWKRLTPSLPVPFLQTPGQKKCPIPESKKLSRFVSTLKSNCGLFFEVTENFKVLVAGSLSGWERETDWRDQEPRLSPFQFS